MCREGPPHLSQRERLALMLMLQHCTVAGIGDALNISEPAVHALIGRITGRLEAASREAHQRQRATDDGQPAVVPCVPRWVH